MTMSPHTPKLPQTGVRHEKNEEAAAHQLADRWRPPISAYLRRDARWQRQCQHTTARHVVRGGGRRRFVGVGKLTDERPWGLWRALGGHHEQQQQVVLDLRWGRCDRTNRV